MKKVYWRPRYISRTALILIAVIALVGLFVVEHFKVERDRPYYDMKLAAARRAGAAMSLIKAERLRVGPPIDPVRDPTHSGLIGVVNSPVTSVAGLLSAKQTSVNANFAAVIVDMLKRAGVEEGDVVALGCSGSFPALNICAYAAVEAIGAEAVPIASASASQWGANVPRLLWVDMEKRLQEESVLKSRSVAASIGGDDDLGLGLTDEGRREVVEAIEQNGLPLIELEDFSENVDRRVGIYRKSAQGRQFSAYINVGGGALSTGHSTGKRTFRPGLNMRPPAGSLDIDGVMPRLSRAGTPVLNLVNIIELAEQYGLPVAPTEAPEVGVADVLRGVDYNPWLVVGVLGLILVSLYSFIRSDIGFRLLRPVARRNHGDDHPEPMV